MTENAGGARPAANRPAAETTVPKPRRWKPDPRNAKALDRHIARAYGREYVDGRWSA